MKRSKFTEEQIACSKWISISSTPNSSHPQTPLQASIAVGADFAFDFIAVNEMPTQLGERIHGVKTELKPRAPSRRK